MADRVELTFRRAADSLVPSDTPLLAAVSGGGDSMALLHLLHAWAPGRGVSLRVAHLDHGLREGSDADRAFVEDAARRLGLPCCAERREVCRGSDESPAEAARRVRRRFLLETAQAGGCAAVATGHTLDDQAETVLMRLARGAGPSALGGMAAHGPGPFVRPLLGLERAPLRDWLGRHGIEYREDPTNDDPSFDRTRARHRVLPVLAAELNPRAARHLVEAAETLREDALYLDVLAGEALERLAGPERPGPVELDSNELARLPAAVARRVAHLALRRAGADPRRICSRHVAALLELARAGSGKRLNLPGGVLARRERRCLRLLRAEPD